VGIGITTPAANLDVEGTLKLSAGGTAAAGNVLTSDATGNATWQTPTGYIHNIGDLYGGGIIVDVWDSSGVQHGLIASLTDISDTAGWSNITSTLIGATAESFSNGKANTTAIMAQGATSGAAYHCVHYNGSGYTDWYLPAVWELDQCYKSAAIVNHNLGDVNGFQPVNYWSSTEDISTSAWGENFPNGTSTSLTKSNTYSVRAVRRY
jgi:hypothetical protein